MPEPNWEFDFEVQDRDELAKVYLSKINIDDLRVFQQQTLLEDYQIITNGYQAGRICRNIDDNFFALSEFKLDDLCEVIDFQPEMFVYVDDEDEDDDRVNSAPEVGIPVEYVVFENRDYWGSSYLVPREWLRPANLEDLLVRMEQLDGLILGSLNLNNSDEIDWQSKASYLSEYILVQRAIFERMEVSIKMGNVNRNVFLCHSSDDKPIVRRFHDDLVHRGVRCWLDEFQISLGDSIVDAIESAQEEADYVLLFWSESSVQKPWVKKEWQSALSRFLKSNKPKIIPIILDDMEPPNLLSDVKYLRMTSIGYSECIRQLIRAIDN